MIEGTFLAESTGSILAIYADDNAIINNCDFDSNNDDVWIANEKENAPAGNSSYDKLPLASMKYIF